MKKIIIIMISCLGILAMNFMTTNHQNKVIAENISDQNETEFRAAWISYYTGDINYQGQQNYMDKIDNILDTLEYYNMNAMIFHIRANHDAWYNSKINKINSQLIGVDFDVFDPLEYVITEAHKRGIEFHAWLNPYRIGSTYGSKQEVADAYSAYPNNPASNENNVLIGSPLQILDPGIPEVREFIIDTCLEIVENYDVDAIHFDDYFYADGIDDSETRAKYNTEGLSVSDFRRKQVDTFIYNLKLELDEFNAQNNRFVQLGISPTGVYKNASSQTEANTPIEDYVFDSNGNLIYPTGATIGCQMHYESYLYCDTLKWVNNEWINYILPQTYWAQNHSLAPYEKLINWWNQAVSKKNVNLYAGMGIYMWLNNANEAYEQLVINDALENVQGTSIYSYKQIAAAYNNIDASAKEQMNDVKNYVWKNKTILPKVQGFNEVKLGSVQNFLIDGNSISFDRLEGAKFYIIYKDQNAINYDHSQIVDIIGGTSEIISWRDSEEGNFVYDVVPLSYTNTLGEPTIHIEEYVPGNITCQISLNSDLSNPLPISEVVNIETGNQAYLLLGNDAPSKNLNDYLWSTSNNQVVDIDEEGNLNIKKLGTAIIEGKYKLDNDLYCKLTLNICNQDVLNQVYNVRFLDANNRVLKEEMVKYGNSATPPTYVVKEPTDKYTFVFKGWSQLYYNIVEDLDIIAVFEPVLNSYHVTFKNPDGEILKEEDVLYGHSSTPPENPKMDPTIEYSYRFSHWDSDYTTITNNIVITAVYNQLDNLYQLSFETNGGTTISSRIYFHYEEIQMPTSPTKDGFVFDGWYYDEQFTQKCQFPIKLTENTTIFAKWVVARDILFYDEQGQLLYNIVVKDGDLLSYRDGPIKEGYDFIGWSLSQDSKDLFDFETIITKDYNLYAYYEEKSPASNYYVVVFYDLDGEIIKVQEVEEGTDAIAPEPPKVDGYLFKGWDKNFNQVNSDLEIHPIYEIISKDNTNNCSCKESTYFIVSFAIVIFISSIIFLKKRNH